MSVFDMKTLLLYPVLDMSEHSTGPVNLLVWWSLLVTTPG